MSSKLTFTLLSTKRQSTEHRSRNRIRVSERLQVFGFSPSIELDENTLCV